MAQYKRGRRVRKAIVIQIGWTLLLLLPYWNAIGRLGISLFLVGAILNTLVVVTNGLRMPVMLPPYLQPQNLPPHVKLRRREIYRTWINYITDDDHHRPLHRRSRLKPLGDLIHLPWSKNRENAVSIGDLVSTTGFSLFFIGILVDLLGKLFS